MPSGEFTSINHATRSKTPHLFLEYFYQYVKCFIIIPKTEARRGLAALSRDAVAIVVLTESVVFDTGLYRH